MSDLVVNDQVYVMKENQVISSPVLAIFRHHRSSIRFIDIYTTESIFPLRLTPLHSLLVRPKHSRTERYAFAQTISVDDFVFSSDSRFIKVTNIIEILVSNDIVYAPLTFEGSIIVNGLVASCYGTLDHSIMHMITIPIRWWYFILLQFHRLPGFDYCQSITSNLIVLFIDFYGQNTF